MSLYSLADGLFEEIDRARSLHQTTTRGTWWSGQQHPLESVTVREEPNWPPHRGRGDTNSEVPPWFHGRKRRDSSWDEVADNVDHTPTIELLAGCLQEIQQSRCGGKPKPVSEPTCRWEIKKTERARNLLPKGRDVAAYSDGADTSRRNHDAWVVRRNQLEEGIQLKMYQTPGKNNTDTREEETTATANSPTRHVRARALGYSSEDNSEDDVAAEALAEFERELIFWKMTAGTEAPSPVRTEFAAKLSEKYLCDVLDTLPSSAEVCRMRKEVARRIDLLITETGQDGDEETHGSRRKVNKPRSLTSNNEGSPENDGHRARSTIKDGIRSIGGLPVGILKYAARPDDVVGVQLTTGRGRRMPSQGMKPSRVRSVAPGSRSSLKKGVRFLLEGSGTDGSALFEEATGNSTGVAPVVKLHNNEPSVPHEVAIDEGRYLLKTSLPWTCPVCDKRNDAVRVECIVCRRRRQLRNSTVDPAEITTKAHLDASTMAHRRPSDGRQKERDGQRDNPAYDPLTVSTTIVRASGHQLAAGGVAASNRHNAREGEGRRKDDAKDGHGEGYDFSGFARMQRTTEPVVRARINLTGEIKSLLSAIRGR